MWQKWHRKVDVQPKRVAPHRNSYKYFFSVTQSFFLGFPGSSDNITTKNHPNQRRTSYIQEPISISELTKWYLHQNIIILLLCQYGLFMDTYVSKMRFSTSSDIMWYAEAVIYAKNLVFPHSMISYLWWITQGRW